MRYFLFVLSLWLLSACAKDSDDSRPSMESPSLMQHLEQDNETDHFRKAIGLASFSPAELNQNYTAFIPSDSILEDFLNSNGFASLEDFRAVVGQKLYDQALYYYFLPASMKIEQMTHYYLPTLAKNRANQPIYIYTRREKNKLALNGNEIHFTERDRPFLDHHLNFTHNIVKPATIYNLLAANGDEFSILKRALERSSNSLSVQLNRDDQLYTIFAPTDAAFDQYFQELGVHDLEGFISSRGTDSLAMLLNYHIINGSRAVSDLMHQTTSSHHQGYTLTIALENEALVVIDAHQKKARVLLHDISAFNGMIHSVDKVLNIP